MTKLLFLSLCLSLHCAGICAASDLTIIGQWYYFDFVFPSAQARQNAVDKGYYLPQEIVNPIDVDVHYKQNGDRRVFVTFPRFAPGRPITLGTVDSQGWVNAYPNYAWNDNQGQNCDGLTSVWRTAIDKCNRLWVLDAGRLGDDDWSCGPQVLAFDLNTDRLLYRHRLNSSSYTNSSLLITPVVDVRSDDCSDTFVYMADVERFAIVVLDVRRDVSWAVTHRLFYPYPSAGSFYVDGESFDLMDGVLGMALSPLRNGDRSLFFHALASVKENVVQTRVLRDSSFLRDSTANPDSINVLPGSRSNQSAAEAMDSKGILYYGLVNPPSIWCWNSNTKFSRENLYPIAIDRETLQFASGVKVITNRYGGEELWVMTSSFQRVMTGSINRNRLNFRIHAGDLSKILRNSPCVSPYNNMVKTPGDDC